MRYSSESWRLKPPERIETMAAKIAALMFGSINMFLYIAAWFANLDNIKSTILFMAALGMTLYRFYRWAITSIQNKKLKDLLIREKEIELLERQQKLK